MDASCKKRRRVAFHGKLQQTNAVLSLVEGLWERKATVCNMFDPRAYIDLILQLVKLKLVLSTP